jgi:transposase
MLKTIRLQLSFNKKQSKIIDEWMSTSNYIYNKTISYIKKGHNPDFNNLRDLIITEGTKKNSDEYKSFDDLYKKLHESKKKILNELNKQKKANNNTELIETELFEIKKAIAKLNQDRRDAVKNITCEINKNVNKWELNTPKDIRAEAVNEACIAYTTNKDKFNKGTIKHFNMSFRKKQINKTISIPPSLIKIVELKIKDKTTRQIKLAPLYLGKDNCYLKLNKKTYNKYIDIDEKFKDTEKQQQKEKFVIDQINHECKITKKNNKYFLLISQDIKIKEKIKPIRYCGIDPGVRSFMTVFRNDNCYEYKYNKSKINKLNNQINSIKNVKLKQSKRKTSKRKRRKKAYNKREKKKENLIDELHWKTVNDLVNKNDVIFYGDIKSHNISKTSNNKNLNKDFNDLKFYKFKCRLTNKMLIANKLLYLVHEANTTKTCSFCGTINNPFSEKIYRCCKCNILVDRDVNAAKNILMKGIIKNLIET